MTDPNTPDQKPADPKPAGESKSESGRYISPRLREKLSSTEDSTDDWSPKPGSPLPAIIATVVVLAIAIAGFMWWRGAAEKQKVAQAAAAAVAHADSLATAARAESLATAARADSAAADSIGGRPGAKPPGAKATSTGSAMASASGAKKPPASSSPAASSSAASGSAAPPAPATSGFGIVVGRYMDEDRANSERDRLSSATGLAGMVAPATEGGTTLYRVILGKFASRGPAEVKATALADSGVVREANVVARPK